eukprot:GGOE01057396.1.p3 GENE.GGOE01057396.1~~GGOE01057396.1.p3  ORF type:complete len:151 (+),score=5.83 GGOE01057396.1:359-811(+)
MQQQPSFSLAPLLPPLPPHTLVALCFLVSRAPQLLSTLHSNLPTTVVRVFVAVVGIEMTKARPLDPLSLVVKVEIPPTCVQANSLLLRPLPLHSLSSVLFPTDAGQRDMRDPPRPCRADFVSSLPAPIFQLHRILWHSSLSPMRASTLAK